MKHFNRFTADNTDGFTEYTLMALNAEFDMRVNEQLEKNPEFSEHPEFKSWCDYTAERIIQSRSL